MIIRRMKKAIDIASGIYLTVSMALAMCFEGATEIRFLLVCNFILAAFIVKKRIK